MGNSRNLGLNTRTNTPNTRNGAAERVGQARDARLGAQGTEFRTHELRVWENTQNSLVYNPRKFTCAVLLGVKSPLLVSELLRHLVIISNSTDHSL